jgi:nucleoside-diphosphate-sugar epimerase
MVYAYNASFKLPTITIRPFNTFGPRQSTRAVIPTVITQIANGKKRISLGSTSPTRDFTYVSDTVNGFIKALSAPNLFGSTINLGTGYEISISDLVTTISREMNQEIIIETSDERLRPKDSEVERLLADNSLALTSLNWRPEIDGKRGLEMGLKKTIAWFTDPANLALYRNGQFVV